MHLEAANEYLSYSTVGFRKSLPPFIVCVQVILMIVHVQYNKDNSHNIIAKCHSFYCVHSSTMILSDFETSWDKLLAVVITVLLLYICIYVVLPDVIST